MRSDSYSLREPLLLAAAILHTTISLPLLASGIGVQEANINSGVHAARLAVSRTCTAGDAVVPDGPITSDPPQEPCGALTANDVDVVSGSVRFKAGESMVIGNGFSVASAATIVAEVGPGVLGTAFLRDLSPDAEQEYQVRFHLDTDNLDLTAGSQQFEHFVAFDAAGNREFVLGLTYNSTLDERRLWSEAYENDGTLRTDKESCEQILPSGWHNIEARWRASTGTDGDLEVSIDGDAFQSLANCLALGGGLDNSGGEISSAEWGVQNVPDADLGSMDLDDFDSWGLSATDLSEPLLKQAWSDRYNSPQNDWDQANDLAVDAAGNVYVTGGGLVYGYATMKYDAAGNRLWLRRYSAVDWARAIAVDRNGNAYVTGQPATIGYAPDGQIMWLRDTWVTPGEVLGLAIETDAAGGIYVAGWARNPGKEDFGAIAKYASNGVKLWEDRYYSPGKYSSLRSLEIDAVGNVYVAGISSNLPEFELVTAKYDSTGTRLWLRTYPNATGFVTSETVPIAVDDLGDLYVAAGVVEPGGDYLTSDFLIIKYRSNGTGEWVRRYDGPGHKTDYATSIALDSQFNVVVAGYSWGDGTDWDFATIKYDSTGQKLWTKRFHSGRDAVNAVALDRDDSVYVTGGVWSPLGFTTIKYDKDGDELWMDQYGGPADLEGWVKALVLDRAGNVYVTGYSNGDATDYDFATIKYSPRDLVFSDGFESADTSAWSATVP